MNLVINLTNKKQILTKIHDLITFVRGVILHANISLTFEIQRTALSTVYVHPLHNKSTFSEKFEILTHQFGDRG